MCLLKAVGQIPNLPVFLNSPMAADATRIYARYRTQHRLDPAQCEAMSWMSGSGWSIPQERRYFLASSS